MELKIPHTDKIGSVLWILLAVGIVIVSKDLPVGTGETGAAFYPRVIAVLIGVFALLQLGQSIYQQDVTVHTIRSDNGKAAGTVAVLVTVYVLSLPWLGFVLATMIFLIVSMAYSGGRSPVRIGGSAVGISLLLYYLFAGFLRVPLPESPFIPVGEMLPGLIHAGHGVLY